MNILVTNRITIIIVLSAVLSFTACMPEPCYEDTISFINAGLYITGTGTITAPDSISVTGYDTDDMHLYNNTKQTEVLRLPLDPATDSCSFIFTINNITDTVTFVYSSFPHLISKECGYSFFHNLDASLSTSNLIDTILIREPNVTTSQEENISIFY